MSVIRALKTLTPGLSTACALPERHLLQGLQNEVFNSSSCSLARRTFFKGFSSTSPPDEKSGEEAETASSVSEHEAILAEKDAVIAEKEAEVKALTDKCLRTLADMENLRERSSRQQENTKLFAVQGLVKSLLDVSDNLELATSSVSAESLSEVGDAEQTHAMLKTFYEGVSMTEKQLMQVFKQNGVERYDALGKEFDPEIHMAMFKIPDPSKEPNTVAHVAKVGYMLNQRVIRPAEVGVVVES